LAEAGFDTATLSEIDLNGLDAGIGRQGILHWIADLHGVRKTVKGTVDVRAQGHGLRVRASFPVDLPDYGIGKPRYLGVGVKDIVQVEWRLP
jgi:hypothetical protein